MHSERWGRSLKEHRLALDGLAAALGSQWDPAVSMLALALAEGKKILICGSGGFAAIASLLASLLVVRFKGERKAYHALSLSNAEIVTAAATDYGFESAFARQIAAYGVSGDVLIAFATDENRVAIDKAIRTAKFRGMGTLGIAGAVPLACDVDIVIPTCSNARCRELVLLAAHVIVEGLEERLPK